MNCMEIMNLYMLCECLLFVKILKKAWTQTLISVYFNMKVKVSARLKCFSIYTLSCLNYIYNLLPSPRASPSQNGQKAFDF